MGGAVIPQTNSQVSTRAAANQRGLVINVDGYFNGALHREFRQAFESQGQLDRYAVNLQRCEGIDSAGLGLLLLLRDFARVEKKNLLIAHCPAEIRHVLYCANFDQIFTISS